MTPVYTSDPALPRRPQDSVPACPLRLWPDETFTHRHSSAWHDVLPLVVEAQLREHSRKLDEVRAGIERLVAGPYVELFARQSSPGWATAFSNQFKLFETLDRSGHVGSRPPRPGRAFGPCSTLSARCA